jgi:hypothetical protein
MGDFLLLLQTTSDRRPFIGGTQERGATSDGIVSSSITIILEEITIKIKNNFKQ